MEKFFEKRAFSRGVTGHFSDPENLLLRFFASVFLLAYSSEVRSLGRVHEMTKIRAEY